MCKDLEYSSSKCLFDDEITNLTGISNFQVIVIKKNFLTHDTDSLLWF